MDVNTYKRYKRALNADKRKEGLGGSTSFHPRAMKPKLYVAY